MAIQFVISGETSEKTKEEKGRACVFPGAVCAKSAEHLEGSLLSLHEIRKEAQLWRLLAVGEEDEEEIKWNVCGD